MRVIAYCGNRVTLGMANEMERLRKEGHNVLPRNPDYFEGSNPQIHREAGLVLVQEGHPSTPAIVYAYDKVDVKVEVVGASKSAGAVVTPTNPTPSRRPQPVVKEAKKEVEASADEEI
jgi:hypothetical protein